MEKLLMLVHRIPYPPNKGDKIRSYHMLRHLAQHYSVVLGTFVDDPDDWRYAPVVREMCADAYFGALHPWPARLRCLGALCGDEPLSLAWYRDARMDQWVRAAMARERINRIVVFSSAMAQYARPYAGTRQVIDFCDVDSDKWRQYASARPWPASWLYAREARRLLAYEREVARRADSALFVSRPEAHLFRSLAPESADKTAYFNIGVDSAYFSPARAYPDPYPQGAEAIVFCGAMDYWPNVDAARWFALEVMPQVKRARPAAVFYVVGARPSAEVRRLEKPGAVCVTGTVADVRPYVAHARLSVAPLRIARGVQTKVLEAMAMAKTVVLSPQALGGIEATPGKELLLANGAGEFAAQVLRTLARPDPRIGRAARLGVRRRYAWSTSLDRVVEQIEGGRRAHAH
ncbi:TIGR03087 family PEP-CTERM/XrtA system glycosyltransferase [Pseudoduganella sp. GCM10020061]|uniref:TIGR03087 family PEP-CTERM/XrtA system glycosyltransferase n=1 Tax=Pseudoduganella sp. GCM10020061 TaxID=3317345 RepID=UPI003626983A